MAHRLPRKIRANSTALDENGGGRGIAGLIVGNLLDEPAHLLRSGDSLLSLERPLPSSDPLIFSRPTSLHCLWISNQATRSDSIPADFLNSSRQRLPPTE
jgi:hypothetical protein